MKRFSIVQNGYDIDEVNRFIDIVIRRLEKLDEENKNSLAQSWQSWQAYLLYADVAAGYCQKADVAAGCCQKKVLFLRAEQVDENLLAMEGSQR